ncbi:hypothetical protein [Kineococcus xinjiangensis]|uniref:hypothetical protein n=1 Tax=Kineococcus xinjiangensis TaxID=512762 RepID=UPI0011B008AA|nr:hypothetical protein [Kineococcus xinjiangensis]
MSSHDDPHESAPDDAAVDPQADRERSEPDAAHDGFDGRRFALGISIFMPLAVVVGVLVHNIGLALALSPIAALLFALVPIRGGHPRSPGTSTRPDDIR